MKTTLKPGFFVSDATADVDFDWLFNRIKETYWGGWLTRIQFARALERSHCFSLFRELDGKPPTQVGFARVISDGETFSSITDVLIESGYRNQGLGTLLMKHVIAQPYVSKTISVLSTKDQHSWYRKFGYINSVKCQQRNPDHI